MTFFSSRVMGLSDADAIAGRAALVPLMIVPFRTISLGLARLGFKQAGFGQGSAG